MARKAFYFDQEACVGCRGCQIVCKDKIEGADLELGVFYRTVKNYESGSFPKVGRFSVSMTWQKMALFCRMPPCASAAALVQLPALTVFLRSLTTRWLSVTAVPLA